jgi:hypothetical protein
MRRVPVTFRGQLPAVLRWVRVRPWWRWLRDPRSSTTVPRQPASAVKTWSAAVVNTWSDARQMDVGVSSSSPDVKTRGVRSYVDHYPVEGVERVVVVGASRISHRTPAVRVVHFALRT